MKEEGSQYACHVLLGLFRLLLYYDVPLPGLACLTSASKAHPRTLNSPESETRKEAIITTTQNKQGTNFLEPRSTKQGQVVGAVPCCFGEALGSRVPVAGPGFKI